jgi:hypothetical protein
MGAWSFASAELRMSEAESVLDRRDQMKALADRAGVSLPSNLESEYEKADGTLTAASEIADRQLGAATTLALATERVEQSRSIAQRVGLLFGHPDRTLTQARDAFAADDTDRAAELARAAQREVEHAATTGRNRLLVTGTTLVVLVAVAFAIRQLRRNDGDHDATPSPENTAEPLAPPPPLPVSAMPPPPPPPQGPNWPG